MKTIVKAAITALAFVAVTGPGQAKPGQPVWHFPYKGAPYATQAEPDRNVAANETKAKRTLHYMKIAKKPHASKSIATAR